MRELEKSKSSLRCLTSAWQGDVCFEKIVTQVKRYDSVQILDVIWWLTSSNNGVLSVRRRRAHGCHSYVYLICHKSETFTCIFIIFGKMFKYIYFSTWHIHIMSLPYSVLFLRHFPANFLLSLRRSLTGKQSVTNSCKKSRSLLSLLFILYLHISLGRPKRQAQGFQYISEICS